MSVEYYLGVDSANAIEIYPGYDYKPDIIKDESTHRSRGENLDMTIYKWGSYNKFEFSLEFVPDSNHQIINEWWEDNTSIVFFRVDSAGDCDAYDVKIRNKSLPLATPQKPYIDQYNGKLILEEYS